MICTHRLAALPAFLWRLPVLALLPALLSAAPATQPSDPQYASSADAGQVSVQGTSTLHDWTVKSGTITGKLAADGDWTAGSASPIQIKSIDLTIPVNSLKSGEGSGMDNTTYDALKSKQNPNITFQLTQASLKAPPSKNDPDFHFKATGKLTVAGNQRTVDLDLDVARGDDGHLTITVQAPMTMTAFGISPPTAMFGVIKSGDAITVEVIWHLRPQPPAERAEK
jgi:polyisoprenoid-binding protein YceI